MILYDGKSDIDWFYDNHPSTVGEMKKDETLPGFTEEPVVLYDNGAGKVYTWEHLSSLCGKWGVSLGDDAEKAFREVRVAMNTPQPTQDDVNVDLSEAVSGNADAIAELSEMISNLASTKEK